MMKKLLFVVLLLGMVLVLGACGGEVEAVEEEEVMEGYEVVSPTPTPSPMPTPQPTPSPEPIVLFEPWPLPAVEISDFGRQVTEEFLSQFESLFVPLGWPDPDTGIVYISIDGELVEAGTMPHIFSRSSTFFDRFGNEIADGAPFIVDHYLASRFVLYDLDYSGIPDIAITFAADSLGVQILYRFVDGRYVPITASPPLPFPLFVFLYDHDGNLGLLSGLGGSQSDFYHATFDDNLMILSRAFWPPTILDVWLYGLTEIPPLRELEQDIRDSITHQHFPELIRSDP